VTRPDSAEPVTIRPYHADDRARVRRVCFLTGYMGDPVQWMWPDEESFSDLFTSYWTDGEPESALVAELRGEVAGYLLGCMDSRRVWNPERMMARHLVGRALLFRPATAPVMWRMATDAALDAARRRLPTPVHDPRWPAHLHIDLLPDCRGRGVGGGLVHRWLDTLRERGVAGCHLQTMAENTSAIAFFESVGFRRVGEPTRAPGFRTPEGGRLHVQLMVQPLD
jgi:ribosomal protein S18 acetylase RimI-like enzyme